MRTTYKLWLYFVLVTTILLPLIGIIYALVIWYLPIVFFNPLITCLFALTIIIVHNLLVIEYGNVHHTHFTNFSGHVAIGTAIYTHWIAWIALAEGEQNFFHTSMYYLTNPYQLAKMIGTINQTGTWWGPGGTWSGWPLAITWILETLFVYYWVIRAVKKKVIMQSKANPIPIGLKNSSSKSKNDHSEMVKRFAPSQIIDILKKKEFNISLETLILENPDPREVNFYQQTSILIDNQRNDLWADSILFIEETNLICLLLCSVSQSWHYEVTIIDLNSHQKVSLPPEFHYQGQVNMKGSTRHLFYLQAGDTLISIDVSHFPEIKKTSKIIKADE